MSWYVIQGWYTTVKQWGWKIISSHLFFAAVLLVVGFFTYEAYKMVPEGDNQLATRASVIQAGGVVIGLFSIVLAAIQVRVNANWNKVLSYHNHFGQLITTDVLDRLEKTAEAKEFTDNLKNRTPISKEVAQAIYDDGKHDRVLSCYLDEFEEFCGAVNLGAVDMDYAYRLEGTRVVKVWEVFQNYAFYCREKMDCPTIYKQLEHLAGNWHDRMEFEKEQRAKADRKGARNGAISPAL
ncbi:TPA: DUF4760 domain-containing protein [Stenotrophomonas maltophilia]|uniref:DUF4760 domain-containing protein n=1 Tax=Stenotrophomonas maltophilia TaxID=40324 RepID=UPI000DA3CC4F|nr:DUF4760 domain-containing protein [Stenotrophomonas maltophilia]SQG66950.1 Uncharacterised protein [Stenotrophomonas maltophilia]